MKETLNYYYNLTISEVEKWGNIYRFNLHDDQFYFVPLKRNNSELNDLLEVTKELKMKGLPVHDLILNRFNSLITNVYNTNYILLKPLGNIYEEYDLNSIVNLSHSLTLTENKSQLYRISWNKLWSDKIDYFEYQIRELGKDKTIILNSFSYYIGLGENAICYVNSTLINYKPTSLDKVSLSHRRIKYPNYKLNFFNPLSFIFDLEIRDIAEYLKSAFFAGENALSYLSSILKHNKYSIYSLQLLYARLLYPTYYFDLYEEIMNNDLEEETLIPIIEKSEAYETFLKDAYYEISRYAPIERVEWLLKKES